MKKLPVNIVLGIALLAAGCSQQAGKPVVDRPQAADTAKTEVTRPARIPADRLIVPAKSIGQTRINEGADSVVKRLGRPDAGDAAMGKQLMTWYAKHDTNGYKTSLYCARDMGVDDVSRVKQIRITSPWFYTADSVHVGSTVGNIAKLYAVKRTAHFTERGRRYDIYDTAAGIAFVIDSVGRCTEIIVHEAGRDANATYLPFHEGAEMVE